MRRRDIVYHHLRALPTIFMDDKENAEYHLKNLCPGCKVKESRHVPEIGGCLWKYMWGMGIRDISPRGISFWDTATMFVTGKVDMEKYIEAVRLSLVEYL